MVGSHYFGRHPEGLGNTTQGRFAVFMNEFKVYAELRIKPGVEVFNLSPISALDVFPKRSLDDLEALCKP